MVEIIMYCLLNIGTLYLYIFPNYYWYTTILFCLSMRYFSLLANALKDRKKIKRIADRYEENN